MFQGVKQMTVILWQSGTRSKSV